MEPLFWILLHFAFVCARYFFLTRSDGGMGSVSLSQSATVEGTAVPERSTSETPERAWPGSRVLPARAGFKPSYARVVHLWRGASHRRRLPSHLVRERNLHVPAALCGL